jgi:hypothetical protein
LRKFGVRLWGLDVLVLAAGSNRRGSIQICCRLGVSCGFETCPSVVSVEYSMELDSESGRSGRCASESHRLVTRGSYSPRGPWLDRGPVFVPAEFGSFVFSFWFRPWWPELWLVGPEPARCGIAARAGAVGLGPPALTFLLRLSLVLVSESPEAPVGPAAFSEGIVRVDGCVRLVPST